MTQDETAFGFAAVLDAAKKPRKFEFSFYLIVRLCFKTKENCRTTEVFCLQKYFTATKSFAKMLKIRISCFVIFAKQHFTVFICWFGIYSEAFILSVSMPSDELTSPLTLLTVVLCFFST